MRSGASRLWLVGSFVVAVAFGAVAPRFIEAALPAAITGQATAAYLQLRPVVADDTAELMRRLGPLPKDGAVPRHAPTRLPADWGDVEFDGAAHKAAFVRIVLPLVLTANEAIAAERQRLKAIAGAGGPRSRAEQRWLDALARRYGMRNVDYERLLRRVDIVPVSLALAQAAIESGWGRSRFARTGNALFGQWTWDTDRAMRPEQQRAALGDYGIRRFRSLADSVRHYMANLNRHRAYGGFRRARAAMRAAGWPVNGAALAPALAHYSEHREGYVALLRQVIAGNRLGRFDAARLVPAGSFAASSHHDRLAPMGRLTGS